MNILDDFFRQYEYADWFEAQRRVRKPARDQEQSECIRCGLCCVRRACVPSPDELPAIAEYLEVTVEVLIRTCMVGDEGKGGHQLLRFANTEQRDVLGEFLTAARTFDKGPCIFLRENGDGMCDCLIWSVRPKEAQSTACWEEVENKYDGAAQWGQGDLRRAAPWMRLMEEEYDWREDTHDDP